jgi:hypothetical protein
MKITLLPVHVVSTKMLEAKVKEAREQGLKANNAVIKKLLGRNAAGPVRIKGLKKRK